jgi:hypothetical protein
MVNVEFGSALLPDRVWKKILQDESGCWIWLGGKSSGYGKVRWNGAWSFAHRVLYSELVGEIPEGLHLDHLCRVPRCVNPMHLEPVTPEENRRRAQPYMVRAPKTHCKRGHLLGGDNVAPCWAAKGYRVCRECNRLRAAIHNAKKREEKALLPKKPRDTGPRWPKSWESLSRAGKVRLASLWFIAPEECEGCGLAWPKMRWDGAEICGELSTWRSDWRFLCNSCAHRRRRHGNFWETKSESSQTLDKEPRGGVDST